MLDPKTIPQRPTRPARIEANRRNAMRSTGPRTDKYNYVNLLIGLEPGLRAQLPIILGEDPDDLRQRLDDWIADLDPRSDAERAPIEAAVMASWRLDRCHSAEAA